MALHSSVLAWKIPWMEEPGGLQCMGRKELTITERLHLSPLVSKLWSAVVFMAQSAFYVVWVA